MQAFSGFWGGALKNKAGNIGKSVGELVPLVDELWRNGVQGIEGLSVAGDLLQKINFPGRLALLAVGKRKKGQLTNDTVSALIEPIALQAYQKSRIKQAGITRDALKGLAEAILNKGETAREYDWEIRGEVAEAISEVAKRHGLSDVVSGGTLTDLIAWRAARIPALKERGITEVHIENALTLLANKENPLTGAVAGNLGQNLPLALEEVAKEIGVPITGEDALTAVELLLTGEFFRDAASSIEVTLRRVPQVLISVPSDAVRLPWRIFGLAKAIVDGLIQIPGEAPQFIKDLVTDGSPKSPALLTETLQWLYSNGSFRNAADLVWELTAPDNESLRFALLFFASMHGVRVTPELLDGAREIFRTDTPSLGPAIKEGMTFLTDRYGKRVPEILKPFLTN
jgi:hypothetical protein